MPKTINMGKIRAREVMGQREEPIDVGFLMVMLLNLYTLVISITLFIDASNCSG